MALAHALGVVAIVWWLVCSIGAIRGTVENRPTAVVGAALFLIAAAIAFK